VIGPEPMLSAPVIQYTPGGYTLDGNWTLEPRSIAPVGNVNVHDNAFSVDKAVAWSVPACVYVALGAM
jgi:hypothetical protein